MWTPRLLTLACHGHSPGLSQIQERPDSMSLELTVLSCLKTWEERDTGPSTSGPGAARRDGTWRRRDRARGLPEPAEGHSRSREAERAQGTVTTDTACNLAQENPTRLDTGGHITPPLLHSQTQSQSYQRRPSVAPQARALPHTELQGCWDGGWPLITHRTTSRPAQAQEAHPR